MALPFAGPRTQLQYDPVQLLGTVVEVAQDKTCLVRCEGKDWRVTRAASCLLAPQAGDEVLIAGPIPEQIYLIAVVRQADPMAAARLEVEGDICLTSLSGGISMLSEQKMELRSKKAMDLAGQSFELKADRGEMVIDELSYLGKQAQLAVARTSWVGSLCEVAVDRLTQVAHRVMRFVRDTEQVRAGQIDYEAEQAARIHSSNTIVTAKNLVKVDADQIHMG